MKQQTDAPIHKDCSASFPTEDAQRMEALSLELLDTLNVTRQHLDEYYITLAQEAESPSNQPSLVKDLKTKSTPLKRCSGNLLKSYSETLSMVDELNARVHDIRVSRKKRRILPAPPANSVIDMEEEKSNHFAKGINFYKLFLICFTGSFIGVVVELAWCLIKNGYFESRSGLVYGPFNLLYGIGAVALTLALYRFRNRGSWLSFLGGFVIGSVVEYACSWGQELLFGSTSWDYSGMPFNLNGRICLLYSIFWGILGVWWIKSIYPRMAKRLLRIPNKVGKILTWLLVAFLSVNGLVSLCAVFRWSQRVENIPPANGFFAFFDQHFPDERMERIYANMDFGTEKNGE